MYGIGLQLTSTTIIGGSYSPTSLFAANEPGVWFDNNDAANLNWRYNLLTFSEQFDNAVWTKQQATVTANSAIAPDGSTTADTVVALATLAQHRVDQATTITAGTYTFSCYAKATGYNFAWLRIGTGPNVIVSLADGSMTGLVGGTATAVNVGNGWWRIALSGAALASSVCRINVSSDSAASDFTGDGTSGILIWGAQLELGSTATAYQPITDVTTEVRERFPNATLYQDTAGTLPVTTPGQSVALALDKSRGLALGAELVTNGDFSNGTTGWSSQLGATLTAANGGMRVTGQVATAFSLAFQIVSANLNNALEITWTATVETLGSTNPRVGVGTIVRLFSTSGQYRMIVPGGRADNKVDLNPGTDGVVLFDNITVRELAGNHATQATTASRPLYALLPANGVRNLANGSADVGNAAYWPSSLLMNGVTATKVASGFDTDGLPYVDVRYQGTASGTSHDAAYNGTANSRTAATSGQQFSASLIASVIAGSTANVNGLRSSVVEETAPSTYIGQTYSSVATTGTPATLTANLTVATGNQVRTVVHLSFTNGATIDVTYRVKAIQLELGPARTAYQFNYSNVNIAQPPFTQVGALLYDGVDDFMVTPAVDFSNSDEVTVVAGVRKLSDAAVATLVELTAAGDANNGGFYLRAPTSAAGNNYQGASRGTINSATTATGFAAPISNIVTFQSKIAADNAFLRVNQTPFAPSVADMGTGNFANAPIYFGARAGTSLFFRGYMYEIIARGALTEANLLARTETSINQQTGAY